MRVANTVAVVAALLVGIVAPMPVWWMPTVIVVAALYGVQVVVMALAESTQGDVPMDVGPLKGVEDMAGRTYCVEAGVNAALAGHAAWCQGCNQLRYRRDMAWALDLYRCRMCLADNPVIRDSAAASGA
ncbi:membrane protein [Mycobacterium phage Saguaro]|uniref:Membrane protein n=1 Tax=Mycobacterium phage Saguaro TaxID=2315616 RepID=A0A386KCT0_9CAUD|nr:membrane protein [Mycobacterium phage Saguaro]AYD82066.1 membrane protein [Mycobacterium phage Saguaro]